MTQKIKLMTVDEIKDLFTEETCLDEVCVDKKSIEAGLIVNAECECRVFELMKKVAKYFVIRNVYTEQAFEELFQQFLKEQDGK